MSVYRRSSIPAPLRTAVSTSDLRQLDVVRRMLTLLNEPAAGAAELARLVDEMPVLAARLAERCAVKAGNRAGSSFTGLSFLGNRDFEAVLFELLEDLTDLAAEQAGIPAHGAVFPKVMTVRPPSGSS